MQILEPYLPFATHTCRRPALWESLQGWSTETFDNFFQGFESSRRYLQIFQTAQTPQWQRIVDHVPTLKTPTDIRSFLKAHFTLYENTTLPHTSSQQASRFTGYYEPVIKASRRRYGSYQVPIYKRPLELLVIEDLGYFRSEFKGHRIAGIPHAGTLLPFYDSKAIWGGVLADEGLEIAWATSAIDVFFMHIQGSGALDLDDGSTLHITYDGTNGHPYVALGKVLAEKGLLQPSQFSMQGIKEVLYQNPDQVDDFLSLNPSYVFFKELNSQGPYSRLGVPLVPHGSLAVDPVYVPLGSLLWIETAMYQGLRFAHDIGAAIKGPVRADIYCGQGEAAGQEAGTLNMPGRLYVMEPL